jgi:hypothetical protein
MVSTEGTPGRLTGVPTAVQGTNGTSKETRGRVGRGRPSGTTSPPAENPSAQTSKETILHLLIGLILWRIYNQFQYGAKALLWKGVDNVVKHFCWLSTHLKQNLVLAIAN